MAWLDIVIVAVILVSALISLARGFVREAFSLAIWVLAFWVSWSFFRDLEVPLRDWIGSPTARLGIAFALLMIVTRSKDSKVMATIARIRGWFSRKPRGTAQAAAPEKTLEPAAESVAFDTDDPEALRPAAE